MRSYTLLFLFASFCVSLTVGRFSSYRCDYTKFKDANGWLKLHEMPANWHEARLRCHMEGATLASPLNQALKDAMTSLMKAKNVDCAAFTGIHATFSRGDFASVEGVPLSRIPHTWAKDEPDNYQDNESCLSIMPDGTLADVKCTDTFPYMCYKKSDNKRMSINQGYVQDPRTGSYYKFHTVPRTWSRAYMACMAENGYLAIINSEEEATVIRELFAKNPGGSMIGNFWKDVAFVGFHDWQEHGDWRTVHGETLKEAGYDKFSPGEPNNATTGEYCGAVYRTAMYDDLWCENRYAFICEMDADSLECDEN